MKKNWNGISRLLPSLLFCLTFSGCQSVNNKDVLLDVNHRQVNRLAPENFKVEFHTSKGVFVVAATRQWAPLGVDRFYNLVSNGYYDDLRFFRCIEGWCVQFGIHNDPALNQVWGGAKLKDDPLVTSNTRGLMVFALSGPNSRSNQLSIHLSPRAVKHDKDAGFSPFAEVIAGMEVVEALYNGYGEAEPHGTGPKQHLIQRDGADYLKNYPLLDRIVETKIVIGE
jgi:peptidyl-prolyl cis-trans isomerase A (cyclophilin A)